MNNTMVYGVENFDVDLRKRKNFDLEFDVLDFAFRGSEHTLGSRKFPFDELLLTDTLNHQIG